MARDCENGFDLLSNAADRVDSLGKVISSDMASLSRSNYLTQRENGTLMVKMLSRRITLPVDEDSGGSGCRTAVDFRRWKGRVPLIFREGDRARTAGAFGRQSERCRIGQGPGGVEFPGLRTRWITAKWSHRDFGCGRGRAGCFSETREAWHASFWETPQSSCRKWPMTSLGKRSPDGGNGVHSGWRSTSKRPSSKDSFAAVA